MNGIINIKRTKPIFVHIDKLDGYTWNLEISNCCWLDDTWQIPVQQTYTFVPTPQLGISVDFIHNKPVISQVILCLWGVLELDNHPDHEGQDLRTLRMSFMSSCPIPFIYPNPSRQSTLCLQDLCIEVLTVDGNELRLFKAKTSPLLIL